jgi:hypothetical protein
MIRICACFALIGLAAVAGGCARGDIGTDTADRAAGAQSAPAPVYTSLGGPSTQPAAQTVAVNTVLADADQYNGKYLSLTGTVASVCPKKGCWITLAEAGSKPMFIKFTCPVEGRLIPMEAVGKPAIVEGTVKVVTITQEEARHYKEDAGASPEEIAKIVGPQTQITVASPAARIADLPAAK